MRNRERIAACLVVASVGCAPPRQAHPTVLLPGSPETASTHVETDAEGPPSQGTTLDGSTTVDSVGEEANKETVYSVAAVDYAAEDERLRAQHCAQMTAAECLELAHELEGAESVEDAIGVVRSLCWGGFTEACSSATQWLHVARRREEALGASLEGCRQGDQKACAVAGEYLVYGEKDGVRGDVVAGLKLLRESCAAKNCFGCIVLLSIAGGVAGVIERDPELEAFAEKVGGEIPSCFP